MKVIDKSNREIVLELMQLPKDIRNYNIDEQYYLIHDIIEIFEKSIFIDNSIIDQGNYIPSKRQEATWQNALKDFQTKDYLNAYFEIFDFIDDYGNRENRNFFEDEMKNIKSILIGINKKIKETIDLKVAYQKLIDRLNINSEFNFTIETGLITDENYKVLLLHDNEIRFAWIGNKEIIKDKKIINQIKEVIIKNKKELYEFSKRQFENENGEFPKEELIFGTYEDKCSGGIDLLGFSVCNIINHKELNDFFENFKKELFAIIDANVLGSAQECEKSINLKENKDFNIYLTDGSMVDDKNRRIIELEKDNIKLYRNGKETNIPIANDIRDIIVKYEDEINKYAVESKGVKFTGTAFDNILIVVNNKEYEIDGMTKDEEKKAFYNKMKEEIYTFIKRFGVEDYNANIDDNQSAVVIREYGIDENGKEYEETRKLNSFKNIIDEKQFNETFGVNLEELADEVLKNDESQSDNINTNESKGVNEKYSGISGIVSVKNILIH